MTLLTSLLLSPTALAIADLLAKAALLVGLAGAVTHFLKWRGAAAAAQHLVWVASVVALLALPVLTVVVPAWTVAIAEVPAQTPVPATFLAPSTPAEAPRAAIEKPTASLGNGGAAPASASTGSALPSLSPLELLAALYVIGLAVLLLRLALGSWSVARLARQTKPVTDPAWLALLHDLSWTMGIARQVRLLHSDEATVPMTWGTRHPHILLPTEADAWPVQRRRAVLMHELAHVVRYDCLTQLLASLACAFYWVHPGVWYAASRLRVERERACDDYVIESGMQPRAYASELFEVAQKYRASGITAAAALGMARPSELEGRMLSLMDGFRSHHAASRIWIAAVALGMAAIIVPLGCVQPRVAQANDAVANFVEAQPVAADADADQDPGQVITRTVPAQSGGTLVLDLTTGGNITIRGHDRNSVDVRARLSGRDWRETSVTVTAASRSTVRVESRQTSGRRNFSTSHNFDISVPRRQNIRVRSAGGAIDLSNVEGTFTGNTGGGEIVLSHLRGSANLATGGGSITVTDSRLEGDVRTGGGSVQFRNVSGGLRGDGNTDNFDWEGGAKIEGPVGSPLRYRTAGGAINIESAPTGADLQTGGGAIRVGPAREFVNARTGGGAITIEAIDGRAHATTGAGAVRIAMVGDPRRGNRDVEVHSGTGEVTLWLPDGIEAEFDIETAYTNNLGHRVRIHSDFPLRYTESASWENNNGTPRKFVRGLGSTGSATHKIRVRTVNGDVHVRRGSRRTSSTSTSTSSFVSSKPSAGQSGSDVDCVGTDCTLTIPSKTRSGISSTVGFAFVTGQGSSRREAVHAMARNAPEAAAIAWLERVAFQDPDPEVQREATRELAKFRDEYAVRPLLRIALEHPGEEPRREAATSLGILATDEAIRTLQNMAVADADVGVQRDAVRALAATHDRADVRRRTTSAQIRTMLEQIADSHGNAAIRTLVEQVIGKLGRISGEM